MRGKVGLPTNKHGANKATICFCTPMASLIILLPNVSKDGKFKPSSAIQFGGIGKVRDTPVQLPRAVVLSGLISRCFGLEGTPGS